MSLNKKIHQIVGRLSSELGSALRQIVREEAKALLKTKSPSTPKPTLPLEDGPKVSRVFPEQKKDKKVRGAGSVKRLILKALEIAKSGLSKENLARRLKGTSDEELTASLNELLADQRISKSGKARGTIYRRVLVLGKAPGTSKAKAQDEPSASTNDSTPVENKPEV